MNGCAGPHSHHTSCGCFLLTSLTFVCLFQNFSLPSSPPPLPFTRIREPMSPRLRTRRGKQKRRNNVSPCQTMRCRDQGATPSISLKGFGHVVGQHSRFANVSFFPSEIKWWHHHCAFPQLAQPHVGTSRNVNFLLPCCPPVPGRSIFIVSEAGCK